MTLWFRNLILLGLIASGTASRIRAAEILTFRGAADASAAVALDVNTLAVADDETNGIRLYDIGRPGPPRAQIDLTQVAVIDREHPELDLEGAARSGRWVYWIGSHGRNKDGKLRPNRSCLLLTEVRTALSGPTLVPVGRVYRDLVVDLLRVPAVGALKLEASVRLPAHFESVKEHREKLAPKRAGLNIEALAPGPGGQGLYIGFRNPRPLDPVDGKAKALVVHLINSEDVLMAQARPHFGVPVLLNLRGLGLRSMEYVSDLGQYLLVAGDHDGKTSEFVLYRWSGDPRDTPRPLRTIGPPQPDLNIEALASFDQQTRVLLLSDDGTRRVRVHGKEWINKELPDVRQRTFRGLWLDVR
jgi:hypothetical protein